MMVVLVVVACVVRTMSGEAGSGQGEGGEDRHEDFLVVVRFITSSLSALVGLTHREATVREHSDTTRRKIRHDIRFHHRMYPVRIVPT